VFYIILLLLYYNISTTYAIQNTNRKNNTKVSETSMIIFILICTLTFFL